MGRTQTLDGARERTGRGLGGRWRRWGAGAAAVVVVAAAAGASSGAWRGDGDGPPTVPVSEAVRAIRGGQVARVDVEGAVATLRLQTPMPVAGAVGSGTAGALDGNGAAHAAVRTVLPAGSPTVEEVEAWSARGAQVVVRAPSAESGMSLQGYLEFAVFLLVLGFVSFQVSRMVRLRRGRFPVTAPARQLRLEQVGGAHEARAELQDVIDFLREPGRFTRMGAKCPRGVLLVGPPGTGKTIFARALAGEAGRPMITASGSDFNEMLVGVGASRVRALAEQARRVAPCIVFIDEFESLGGRRGRPNRSGEEETTLTQLLAEMDGVAGSEGIVWMGATNRPELLDPAVRRPGRFDRVVEVPMPSLRDRVEILGIHAAGKPIGEDVDLEELARVTVGYSGAELANLLNEAAILAVQEGSAVLDAGHLERARDKVTLGRKRTGVELSAAERQTIAVHEAGHAIVGLVRCPDDALHKITIEPRGRSLGSAHFAPLRDRALQSRAHLEGLLAKLLGGRAAELEFLGEREVTTGAGDDLVQATAVARRMVGEFGLGRDGAKGVGLLSIAPGAYDGTAPSAAWLARVDEETAALVGRALEEARAVVAEHRAAVQGLADALLEREVLDADEVRALVARHGLQVEGGREGEGGGEGGGWRGGEADGSAATAAGALPAAARRAAPALAGPDGGRAGGEAGAAREAEGGAEDWGR